MSKSKSQIEKCKVLVIEDFPLVRDSLISLIESGLGFEVCGHAGSGKEALKQVAMQHPDLICLDLGLGDIDGFELIRQIRDLQKEAKIIVISMRREETYAEKALSAGALGYIMKSEAPENILKALESIRDGKAFVSSRISMQVMKEVVNSSNPGKTRFGADRLTKRESQVFQLIGLGFQTRQIATRLGIGVKTVETHRENIKNKLGLEHSAALVREAVMWVRESE